MGPEQYPLERLPELGTEDGVDDGVERGVEVTQPQKQRRDGVVHVAGLAEGQQKGHQEKGQPADDERPRDDGQGFGRLAFALRFQRFLSLGDLGVRIRRAGNVQRRTGVRGRVAAQQDRRVVVGSAGGCQLAGGGRSYHRWLMVAVVVCFQGFRQRPGGHLVGHGRNLLAVGGGRYRGLTGG